MVTVDPLAPLGGLYVPAPPPNPPPWGYWLLRSQSIHPRWWMVCKAALTPTLDPWQPGEWTPPIDDREDPTTAGGSLVVPCTAPTEGSCWACPLEWCYRTRIAVS